MNPTEPMLKALAYDALLQHHKVQWTVDLYTAFTQSLRGGPILELGSGTAHILQALIQNGVDAYGLDLEPAMLERGRNKLLNAGIHDGQQRLILGDMRSFQHERTYQAVILPYNTFALLCRREDVLQMLECVRRHLRHGGEFMFDLSLPVDQDWTAGQWQREPLILSLETIRMRVVERGVFDADTRIHQWMQQVAVSDGPTLEIRRTLRHWHPKELVTLFKQAGWVFEPAPIDQTGQAINGQSRLFIGRARQAE